MINNLLIKALDCVGFAMAISDLDGKIIYYNKSFEEFCNYNDLTIREFEIKKSEQILSVIKNNKCINAREKYKKRYIEWNLVPFKNENSDVIGTITYFKDITSYIISESEILKQKSILKTIIDTIPDVIFYKDLNSAYIGGNKRFADNIEMNEKEYIGLKDEEIHPYNEEAKNFHLVDKHIMEEEKIETHVSNIRIKGEDKIWECIKAPIYDENDKVCGIVGISRDITERKMLEKRLRDLSYKDKLTGLYNRTYFDEKIEKLNDEKYLPFSIIMGDINGLKIVNDTLGHLEGDKFIVAIVNEIKKVCSEYPLIFRWGGDEIVILLPNKSEKEAEMILKNIKIAMKKSNYKPIPLSISLGVSSRTEISKDVDSMLKEAENKVYRKKLLQNNSVRNSVIESLQKTLEEKNMETKEHTQRLVDYASIIGKELKLRDWEIDELKLLATLHDIGKIGVPEEILMKPGKLTNSEMEIMKSHTEKGYRIVQVSPEIAHVAKGVLTHHERWDGTGYPLGLKEENIPFLSRIISVLDSYDAMTNDRVYKKGISRKDAISELRRCSGTQFDPKVVDVFINKILS